MTKPANLLAGLCVFLVSAFFKAADQEHRFDALTLYRAVRFRLVRAYLRRYRNFRYCHELFSKTVGQPGARAGTQLTESGRTMVRHSALPFKWQRGGRFLGRTG